MDAGDGEGAVSTPWSTSVFRSRLLGSEYFSSAMPPAGERTMWEVLIEIDGVCNIGTRVCTWAVKGKVRMVMAMG